MPERECLDPRSDMSPAWQMLVLLLVLLLVRLQAAGTASETAEKNAEDAACDQNLSSVHAHAVHSMGCTLQLLISAASAAGTRQRGWVAPAFCVPDPQSWLPAHPCPEHDPVGRHDYVEVPVMLANRTLLTSQQPELAALGAQYLRVENISVAASGRGQRELRFPPRDFIWSAAEPGLGLLRLGCDSIDCFVLAQMIRESRWEPFEPLQAAVTVRLPCGRTHQLTQSIAVQRAAFRRPEPASWSPGGGIKGPPPPPPLCRNLTAEAAFDVAVGHGVCGLRLHRQLTPGGGGGGDIARFHAEPLLCYVGGASVRQDFNRRLLYLRLPLLLRSDAALKAASARFVARLLDDPGAAAADASVAFMRLQRLKLRARRLAGDAGEPEVRLAADGDLLVLRLLCENYTVCEAWRSSLETNPLSILSRFEWLPVSQLEAPAAAAAGADGGSFGGGGGCRFMAPEARLSVPLQLSTGHGSCRGPRFVRLEDGRSFVVVLQRRSNSAPFNGNWSDFAEGFRKDESNFFIGLWRMRTLTGESSGATLRIELQLWPTGADSDSGKRLFVEYSHVRLVDDWFWLKYDRLARSNMGPVDPLARSRDRPFSTRDWVHGDVAGRTPMDAESGRRMMLHLGNAAWWWFDPSGQQADFNPGGTMLPADGSGRLPAVDWWSVAGLNVSASGGGDGSTRGWRPLKEVRLMIEV